MSNTSTQQKDEPRTTGNERDGVFPGDWAPVTKSKGK